MSPWGRVLPCVVVAVAATAPPLGAQRTHEGFWIGWAPAGIGIGPSGALGPAASFRLGGTVTPRVLLGAELISWYEVRADTLVGLAGNLTGTLLYYPSVQGGVFGKAGVGFAVSGDEPAPTGGGLGVTLGGGYDVQLGKNFFLTPSVDWLLQAIDDHERGWKVNNVLMVTLALAGH